MKKDKGIVITHLPPELWEKLKAHRIAAVENEPLAFGTTVEEELKRPDSFWKNRLTDNSQTKMLFAQSEQGTIVGMIGVHYHDLQKVKHNVKLVSFHVSPDVRRNGIGRELLKTAIGEIKQNPQISKIRLIVAASQFGAINLYESFGFKSIGTLRDEIYHDNKFFHSFPMELIFPKANEIKNF